MVYYNTIYKEGIMMAYNKKAQEKYSEKTINFAVKYYPTDIQDGKRLKLYLTQTGQSANSYIKELIKTDLDNKGIAYQDIGE